MAKIREPKNLGHLWQLSDCIFRHFLTIHSWNGLLQILYGWTVTSFARIMSSGIGNYLLFHVRRREVWCSFPVFCWKGRNFESNKPKEQSATCVVAARQREDQSVVPERHDVRRIHFFRKAFYGAVKNAFASLSQSMRRVWFRLFGEVQLQRSPFKDTTSG